MTDVAVACPGGERSCTLVYQGEVRFGPAWYACALEEGVIAARVFGAEALWSDDGRYLALCEWLSTDERAGPDTRLYVADLVGRRATARARARGGFARPLRFEGALLVFAREWLGDADRRDELELDLERVGSWEPLEILS